MKNPIREYIQLVKTIERAKREGGTDELLNATRENAKVQNAMTRPLRHESLNGAGEIGWGLAMLCFALSSYSTVFLRTSSWQPGISWLLMACACLAMPLSRWAIKKYVTWPRIGYFAIRYEGKFWIGIVVGMVVAAGVGIALVLLMQPEITQAQQPMRHASATNLGSLNLARNGSAANQGRLSLTAKFLLAGMGPLNAILYLMLAGVSVGEHRWKWLLLFLLALGPLGICLTVPGGYIELSRPIMLFLGVVCLTSGVATLISFVRHTQRPAPESE